MELLLKPFGGWLQYDKINGEIPQNKNPIYKHFNLYKNINKRIGFSNKESIQRLQKKYNKIYNTQGNFTLEQWKKLIFHYCPDLICLRCKSRSFLVPDHIQSARLGGSNSIVNIQPLCQSCNNSKFSKMIDYRPDKGEYVKTELILTKHGIAHN